MSKNDFKVELCQILDREKIPIKIGHVVDITDVGSCCAVAIQFKVDADASYSHCGDGHAISNGNRLEWYKLAECREPFALA